MAAFVLGGIAATISTTFTTGCSATSQVRQIFTALDGTGDRPRDQFFTDTKQIFCDVVFSAYGADETVDVQFIQVKGESPMFDGSNNLGPVSRLWNGNEAVPSKGISTINFTLDQPQEVDGGLKLPFPVGHWKCVVSVNGQNAGEHEFDVVYPTPDCPATGGAYDGMSCAGYQGGAQCPSDSNYTPGGTDCVCQTSAEVADPATRAFKCP
jgi:hypothetical protein